MAEKRASAVFRHRLRQVRERSRPRISQQDLADRLGELGYTLSRAAITEIERGNRRITLDDWLAIAAALAVAPIHLVAPFEAAEPPAMEYQTVDPETQEARTVRPAELGIFTPADTLEIGDELTLDPGSARSWIRGQSHYPGQPSEEWRRFYYDEVPPPRRHQLDEIIRAAREGREPAAWATRTYPVDEEPRIRSRRRQIRGIPASLWALMTDTDDQPEQEGR